MCAANRWIDRMPDPLLSCFLPLAFLEGCKDQSDLIQTTNKAAKAIQFKDAKYGVSAYQFANVGHFIQCHLVTSFIQFIQCHSHSPYSVTSFTQCHLQCPLQCHRQCHLPHTIHCHIVTYSVSVAYSVTHSVSFTYNVTYCASVTFSASVTVSVTYSVTHSVSVTYSVISVHTVSPRDKWCCDLRYGKGAPITFLRHWCAVSAVQCTAMVPLNSCMGKESAHT